MLDDLSTTINEQASHRGLVGSRRLLAWPWGAFYSRWVSATAKLKRPKTLSQRIPPCPLVEDRCPLWKLGALWLCWKMRAGVSAAARQLDAKQPVVSRKLKVFQESHEWGTLLTEDKELTDAGRAVLPALRELIRRHDQLIEYLKGTSQAPEQIQLGLGHFASRFYLPKVLQKLKDRLEDCEISTKVLRGADRIVAVAEGRLDLAIVTHVPDLIQNVLADHGYSPTALKIQKLAVHELGLVAQEDSEEGCSLAKQPKRKPVPLEKLRNWELVGLDRKSGIRRHLEKAFDPHEIRFVAEGGGWWAALECARVGIGVAVVPLTILSDKDRRELIVRRLDEEFNLQDYLIHCDTVLSPFQEELCAALIRASR